MPALSPRAAVPRSSRPRARWPRARLRDQVAAVRFGRKRAPGMAAARARPRSIGIQPSASPQTICPRHGPGGLRGFQVDHSEPHAVSTGRAAGRERVRQYLLFTVVAESLETQVTRYYLTSVQKES